MKKSNAPSIIKAEVIAPVVSSKHFVWNNSPHNLIKTGIGEASELFNLDVLGFPFFNDAADEGFLVRSERTGELVGFLFDREVMDNEGEVAVIIYTSTCGEFQIHVLND